MQCAPRPKKTIVGWQTMRVWDQTRRKKGDKETEDGGCPIWVVGLDTSKHKKQLKKNHKKKFRGDQDQPGCWGGGWVGDKGEQARKNKGETWTTSSCTRRGLSRSLYDQKSQSTPLVKTKRDDSNQPKEETQQKNKEHSNRQGKKGP